MKGVGNIYESLIDNLENNCVYRAVFDNLHSGAIITDSAGRLLLFNPAMRRMLLCLKEELRLSMPGEGEHPLSKKDMAFVTSELFTLGKKSCTFEKRFLRKDGTLLFCQLTASALDAVTVGEDVLLVVAEDARERKNIKMELLRTRNELEERVRERTYELIVANDLLTRQIAGRKLVEEALVREQKLFTAGPVVVFKWTDADGWPVEYVSPNVRGLFGLGADDLICGRVSYRSLIHPDDLKRVDTGVSTHVASSAQCFDQEYRVIRPDGSVRWIYDFTHIIRDESGKVIHFDGYLLDITERKDMEEKLVSSLKEKEVLLREIHHRVKNNMQIISSLLKLQSSYTGDVAFSEMLKESQNRIRSMALVHEKLYQSKDMSGIDFGDYIRKLVRELFKAYGVSPAMISMDIAVEKVYLGVDTAIPCGLIVNELISNSIKYAFHGKTKGCIYVRMHVDEYDSITLVVGDDGVGSNVNFRSTTTLGLKLVVSLAEEQLLGEIALNNSGGMEFTLKFKEIKNKERF
ncbi:MAG: PAS domain S-box protein [Nitrospirae bacterium]|nr:PAS domain S-box protein [Nitrospirota bacterium]